MPKSALVVLKLPATTSRFQFLSGGATSWVFRVDARIVLKIPREVGSEDFAHEIKTYDILNNATPCPDIIQSFLRLPEGNFLALASGGTLMQRLITNQIREDKRPWSKLLQVKKTEPESIVERWIMELSNAAAWLESLGYAHTDLRPDNLLLDHDDHLKVTDFDRMSEIGAEAMASAAPYCRVLGPEAGIDKGTFGYYGARTESFAIGSLLYLMTRGHEPYEMEEFEDGIDSAPIMIRRFQLLKLPSLGLGHLDQIIKRCWHNEFEQLSSLAEETKLLRGAIKLPRAVQLDAEYMSERRKECQSLVDGGLFADEYFTR